MRAPAAVSFLLGAFTCVLAQTVTWLNPLGMRHWFIRFGWWLSPWSKFPLPYDYATYSRPNLDFGSDLKMYFLFLLPGAIGYTVLLACAMAAWYALAFFATTFAHSQFGFPPYWNSVRTKISLKAVFSDGACRAWWGWPVMHLMFLLFMQIDMGLESAFLKFIIWFPLPLLAGLLATAIISSRAVSLSLRKQVATLITAEELRCGQCGYLLCELRSTYCPECGRAVPAVGSAEFGLVWERWHTWNKFWRPARWVLVPTLLLAPVAFPTLLSFLPATLIQRLPETVLPRRHMLRNPPNPDSFPIRLDAVCEIRHEGSLAVLVLNQYGTTSWYEYRIAFWTDAALHGKSPPENVYSNGLVLDRTGSAVSIGPWQFGFDNPTDTMFWLTRADATYDVRAVLRKDYRGDLSWAWQAE